MCTGKRLETCEIECIIDKLQISDFKKDILKERYLRQLEFFEQRTHTIGLRYNTCRLIVTLCSMTLPTIQSIQSNTATLQYTTEIFWAAILMSLVVMVANGIIGLFSLDRKFHEYRLTFDKLKTEGWLYFELTGHYYDAGLTHETGFVKLFNNLETIFKNNYITNDHGTHENGTTPSFEIGTDAPKDTISEIENAIVPSLIGKV